MCKYEKKLEIEDSSNQILEDNKFYNAQNKNDI